MYLGRADEQVKIRGFRVEPGEIETVLAASPGRPGRSDHPAGHRRGYSGWSPTWSRPPRPGTWPGLCGRYLPAIVREFAASRLPEYMVPSAVVVLEALPLTLNGKLDRKALPAPDSGSPCCGGRLCRHGHRRPLCEVFADVLGLESVGPENDFFALGGHSLLAVRAAARLKERGVSLSPRDIFAAPTVRGLVKGMSLSSLRDVLSVLLPIREQGEEPPVFCIHPAGGVSWSYLPMAKSAPAGIPLYGLQARGLDGTRGFAASLAEMAGGLHRADPHRAAERAVPPAGLVLRGERGTRDGRTAPGGRRRGTGRDHPGYLPAAQARRRTSRQGQGGWPRRS